ncbi:MAG: ankyrin repeat domain-containing protein, partial [Bdellovibrionia bacterium]
MLYNFNGVTPGHAGEFKLLKAIRANDTQLALKLIEKKKNPWFFEKKIPLKERLDRKDRNEDSALISAAWCGNIAILEALLQNG